jgi:hypothetical protein
MFFPKYLNCSTERIDVRFKITESVTFVNICVLHGRVLCTLYRIFILRLWCRMVVSPVVAVCCGKGVLSIKEYGWVQMGVTYMTPCLVLTAQRTKKTDGNKRVRQT